MLSAVRDATIYTKGCPVVRELDDQQMLHIIRTATIRSSIKNRYVQLCFALVTIFPHQFIPDKIVSMINHGFHPWPYDNSIKIKN